MVIAFLSSCSGKHLPLTPDLNGIPDDVILRAVQWNSESDHAIQDYEYTCGHIDITNIVYNENTDRGERGRIVKYEDGDETEVSDSGNEAGWILPLNELEIFRPPVGAIMDWMSEEAVWVMSDDDPPICVGDYELNW